MVLLRRSVFMVFVLLALPFFCLAGWVGPKEVVKGKWGTGPNQFYYSSGDSGESFPQHFGVDASGRIVISDEVNRRIQVFSHLGQLQKIVTRPDAANNNQWPFEVYVHPNGAFVASQEGPLKYFFDNKANFIEIMNIYGRAYHTPSGYLFEVNDTRYELYSTNAILLGAYTERPLELGLISIINPNRNTYKITLPGNEVIINSEHTVGTFSYDESMNIYSISVINTDANNVSSKVVRYTKMGKKTGEFIVPVAMFEPSLTKYSEHGIVEIPGKVIVEYGQPIVAPNGDIYTWKRTPDNYSILKWTWQDDSITPSCPDAKIKQTACDNTGLLKTDMRLTAADLTGKSKEDLRLMRNEIYARHGKTFQSADLQKYFSGKCWYKADPGYSDAMLTLVDRDNIRIIQEAEKGR